MKLERARIYLLFLYHADRNSKSLYFKSNEKKSKLVVHNSVHHKNILESNIYSKLLFTHALTDVIPLPQLTE